MTAEVPATGIKGTELLYAGGSLSSHAFGMEMQIYKTRRNDGHCKPMHGTYFQPLAIFTI